MKNAVTTDTMAIVLREVLPLTQTIITHSFSIDDIPEPHDRLIAGTASHRQLPLITNDPVISHSQHVTVIW